MKIVMAYFENVADCTGGLERILCDFSNAMVERGHSVSIVTNDEHDGSPYYPLNSSVSVINLKAVLGAKGGSLIKRRSFGRCFDFLERNM